MKRKGVDKMMYLELLELEYKHAFELVKEKYEEYEQAQRYFSEVSKTLFGEYAKSIWPEEK